MSLTWDLTNIENSPEVCWEERIIPADQGGDGVETTTQMAGATQCIIFECIATGIGTITEENVGKFAARVELIQRLNGPLLVGPDGPVELTTEDVFAHVGLVTNAAYTDETDAKFIKRLVAEDLKRRSARLQKDYVENREEVPA